MMKYLLLVRSMRRQEFIRLLEGYIQCIFISKSSLLFISIRSPKFGSKSTKTAQDVEPFFKADLLINVLFGEQ